jgi:hypothetical protein
LVVPVSPKADRINLSDGLFPNGVIPSLTITLDDQALAALRLHPRIYVRATVAEGTLVYSNVGVHLKGQYGTFQGTDGKPSLTLKFDKFVRGQRFHGLDKLHLNNSVSDPSYLTELLCREPFRAAGVPAARVTHARVMLNGRDRGLYVLVEGLNKAFLRRHFQNPNGNLYDSEFMHDITYPLRKGSGDGPDDHSDLHALAAAVRNHLAPRGNFPLLLDRGEGVGEESDAPREGEPLSLALTPRLDSPAVEGVAKQSPASLPSVLDLDRFHSFLALELMMGHADGYARARNNYWLYHDPDSGKFVFLPHGMDQMFWHPQGSLLPEVKGMVAQAVLQTAPGLSRFRQRCTELFTNQVCRLTNRLEQVCARLRPVFVELGSNAGVEHDRAVKQLRERMTQRLAYLREDLLSPPPSLVALRVGDQTALTAWRPGHERGETRLERQQTESGSPAWRADLFPGQTPSVAMWQARLRVPPGIYQVFAQVSSEPGVFRGPSRPVLLRLWGGATLQTESMAKDPRTLGLLHIFEARPSDADEVLLQCEFSNADAPVRFLLGPVTLTRLE